MTDYKNLKLIATSNPHIRGSETTRSIMLDVIIAMLPALIWGIFKFGLEALILTAVFAVMAVRQDISQEFMTIYAVIIAFYFGTQARKTREGEGGNGQS